MRIPYFLTSAIALAASLGVSSVSQAQDFTQWHDTLDVSGQLTLPGGTRNVSSVRVELDQDGSAWVRFDDGRNYYNPDGNWRGQNNNNRANWNAGDTSFSGVWYGSRQNVVVDLRQGLNNQTVIGTLKFDLDDDEGRPDARNLSIEGRVLRRPWDTSRFSGTFNLDQWNGGGGWTNHPQAISELSAVKTGNGTLRLGTDNISLRRARVELARDGHAQVQLDGDQSYSYEGRWRQNDDRKIELRLDGTAAGVLTPNTRRRDDYDSLGRGEITLLGSSFQTLKLSGQLGDRNFNANFDVRDNNGGNGGWNGNGGGGNGGFNGNNGNNGGWNGNGGNNGNNGNNGGGWKGNGGWGIVGNNANNGVNNNNVNGNGDNDKPFLTATDDGGTILTGGKTRDMKRVTVNLYNDGRARVQIDGKDSHYLAGTWRRNAVNSYTLTLKGKSDESGTSQLELRGNRILNFRYDGKLDGDKVVVRFGN